MAFSTSHNYQNPSSHEIFGHQAETEFVRLSIGGALSMESALCLEPNVHLEPTEQYPSWYIELTTSCFLNDEEEILLEEYLDELAIGRDYSPTMLVEKLPPTLIKWLIKNNATTHYLIPSKQDQSLKYDESLKSQKEDLTIMNSNTLPTESKTKRGDLPTSASAKGIDVKLCDLEEEEIAAIRSKIEILTQEAKHHISEIKTIVDKPFHLTTEQSVKFVIPKTTDELTSTRIQEVISENETIGNQIITSNLIFKMQALLKDLDCPITHERRRIQNLIYYHRRFIKWSNKHIVAIIRLKDHNLRLEALSSYYSYLYDQKYKGKHGLQQLKSLFNEKSQHLTSNFSIESLPDSETQFTWFHDFKVYPELEVINNYKSLKRFKIETIVLKSKTRNNHLIISIKKILSVHFE